MDTCGNVTLCEEFRHVSHHNLVHYLQNVTFNDVDNFPFQFEEDTHDGPPRYSIISYVETHSGSHTNGNIFVVNLNFFLRYLHNIFTENIYRVIIGSCQIVDTSESH